MNDHFNLIQFRRMKFATGEWRLGVDTKLVIFESQAKITDGCRCLAGFVTSCERVDRRQVIERRREFGMFGDQALDLRRLIVPLDLHRTPTGRA